MGIGVNTSSGGKKLELLHIAGKFYIFSSRAGDCFLVWTGICHVLEYIHCCQGCQRWWFPLLVHPPGLACCHVSSIIHQSNNIVHCSNMFLFSIFSECSTKLPKFLP